MFKDIATVYKKEVKSLFKDKTVLLLCILMPFLMLFGEGQLMSAMDNRVKDEEHNAYYMNAPEYAVPALKELGFKGEPESKKKCLEEIKNKDAVMLVVFPKDFTTEVKEGTAVSDIEVWYNSSDMESLQVKESLSYFLDSLRPVVFTVNADTNTKYDLMRLTSREMLWPVWSRDS